MNLVLLRHGPAETHSSEKDDADRHLTGAGRAKMKKSLRGLCSILHLRPKDTSVLIWHSPLLRSAETALILSEMLSLSAEAKDFIAEADLQPLLDAAARLDDTRTLIIVGHEPYLSQWSAVLTGLPLPFKKGAAAAIKIDPGHPLTGQLGWFLQPAALRDLQR